MSAYSDQFEPYGEPEPFERSAPPGLTCERCGYHATIGAHMILHLMGCLEETEQRSEPQDGLGSEFDNLELFAGIDALLASDRTRAQRLWYPINEDGTFNR